MIIKQSEDATSSNSAPASNPIDASRGNVKSISTEVTPDDDPHRPRNFGLAVLYMVFMRTGWIFKTESIMMPAVLDVIGGSGWLRGCLPMLNRFGQSIPPLLVSDRVRNTPLKKYGLFVSTLIMGVCFLALAIIWALTGGKKSWWLPILFLVIYGVFFSSTGINQLILHTLTGKLIRVVRRGRLALVGTVAGATSAVLSAWFLLNIWLVDAPEPGNTVLQVSPQTSNFTMIFAFTGLMFLFAAAVALMLKERPDIRHEKHRGAADLVRGAMATIQHDRNFCRLTIIAGLFGMYLTLFPHYQSLGRDRLELGLTALVPWVLAQNIGAALFSIPAGWIADRFGNRLVLRIMMLVLCVAPVLALILARIESSGQVGFSIVFCLLGLTPVAMRVFNNYTLEVTDSKNHPRYLSTLSLAMAVPPIVFSSFFGALVDWVGFEFVFSIVVICIFCGWILTFQILEPRNEMPVDDAS